MSYFIDMNEHNISLMHLTNLQANETAEIVSILGGRNASKRLSDLGLIHGTKIKLLRKAPYGGPIEIQFRGTRLMIGYGLANKIQVKRIL